MRVLVLAAVFWSGIASADYVSRCPSDPPPDSPCAGKTPAGGAPAPAAPTSAGGPAGPPRGGAGVGGPSFGGNLPSYGSELTGDPVVITNNTAYHRVVDFTVNTGKGGVRFERVYHSSTGTSGQSDYVLGDKIPTPFGHAPGLGFGVNWWHSWLSYVVVQGTSVRLFDENGVRWDYSNQCSASGCWLDFVGNFAAPGRLQTTIDGFRYVRPGRDEFVFEDKFIKQTVTGPESKTHYFLSKVKSRDGVDLVTLLYKAPLISPSCPLPAAPGSSVGAPYIEKALLAGGALLRFSYGHAIEMTGSAAADACVLSSVALRPAGSTTETTMVTYGYPGWPGAAQAGRVYWANGPQISQSYDYSTGFNVHAWDHLVSANGFPGTDGSGRVTAQSSDGDSASLSFSHTVTTMTAPQSTASMGCELYSCCPGVAPHALTVTGTKLQAGGSDLAETVTATAEVQSRWQNTGYHRPYINARYESCSSLESCSTGSLEVLFNTSGPLCTGASQQIVATKNKLDAWELTPGVALSSSSVSPPYYARNETVVGATKSGSLYSFSGGLESEGYGYAVSSDGQQKLTSVTRASALAPNSSASTIFLYDADGKVLLGRISRGYTMGIFGTTPELKYKGTFYQQARQCPLPGSASDPLKRTLRVEGPCWLPVPQQACTSISQCGTSEVCQEGLCLPTKCPASPAFPVTELEYYPETTGDNLGSRLKQVTQFSQGSASCSTGALVTQYTGYTPDGYPTAIVNSGITTSLTYAGGFLESTSVDVNSPSLGTYAMVTQYGWDEGSLAWILHPEGNYDVYCHRNNGSENPSADGCNGDFTERLQWYGKASTPEGYGTTEVAALDYHPEGSLKAVRFLRKLQDESDFETRRTVLQNVDAHGRTTYVQSGVLNPFSRVTRYDGNDNVVALSPMANAAPDFCKQAGVESELCSWMTNDRAGRLAAMDQFPELSAAAVKTCVDYDVAGNVSRIATGCAGSSTCAVNLPGTKSTCDDAPLDYQWDDFGNVIKASTGSPSPWHRYEYDASGLLVRTRSSANGTSDYLKVVYDQLGRPVSTEAIQSSGNALLHSAEYDGVSPCPLIPSLNTSGRVSKREDSFGTTWYSYDEAGRLIAEYRRRAGAGCSDGLLDNPHTEYEYDMNGNVINIRYPHGRHVAFTYGSEANRDRVTSVQVEKFIPNGTGGVTSAMETLVRDVEWEPLGGLRGYTVVGEGEGYQKSVEYVMSATSENIAGGDPSQSCSAYTMSEFSDGTVDQTGRTRALWVSDGPLALGQGDGARLRQIYTWSRDQIVGIDSCLLGGDWTKQEMIFDNVQRIERSDADNYVIAHHGPYSTFPHSERLYQYDSKSNREFFDVDGAHMKIVDGLSWDYPDADAEFGGALVTTYLDAAGRAYQLDKGGPGPSMVFFEYSEGTATGSVYHSAEISRPIGAFIYEYFYDWKGKRRKKILPTGAQEEYFYDSSANLLADIAGDDGLSATPNYYSVDDYIWLGGRPLAYVRGRIGSGGVRDTDSDSDCDRLSEPGYCGVTHLVTDWMGKIVLALEGTEGRVSGYQLFDEFGSVNRALMPQRTEGAQPYTNWDAKIPSGLPNAQARMMLWQVELPPSSPPRVIEISSQIVLSSVSDMNIWTSWADVYGLEYGEVPISIAERDSDPDTFVVGGHFEYRVFESADYIAFLPFRFPGQRYDPETDLHENWNRYYDPHLGKYLSPEPLLQSPGYVRRMAQTGMSVSTYGYAQNNPLRYVDRDGLRVELMNPAAFSLAAEAAKDPEALRVLEWLDSSPDTYQIWGDEALDDDTGGQWFAGELAGRRESSSRGGTLRVDDKHCARANISLGGALAHETVHAGIRDFQKNPWSDPSRPPMPASIQMFGPFGLPGGGLPGAHGDMLTPHGFLQWYWGVAFGDIK